MRRRSDKEQVNAVVSKILNDAPLKELYAKLQAEQDEFERQYILRLINRRIEELSGEYRQG